MKLRKFVLKASLLFALALVVAGGVSCSDGSSGSSSGGSAGGGYDIDNSYLFYSQKTVYASDDEYGTAKPASLEFKENIKEGDEIGTAFAENAVAFCASGVFGKSNSIVYYVDENYALKSYSADGQKKAIREVEADATGAVIGCDYDSGTVFVLFTKSGSSTLVLVDAETGKIGSTLTGDEIADATAVAGSKSKNMLYVASGKGDTLKVTSYNINGDSFASSSSLDLAKDASFIAVKKDGIDYKITDMAAIDGKLYTLFASCFKWQGTDYYGTYGSYSSAGGVLRLDGENLAVDKGFGENGVAGYSKKVDGSYDRGTFVYKYLFNGSLEDAKTNLEFNNPQKIIAVKPDELVIAENGICYGNNGANNLARAVTMDLNGKIKSVTSVHGKSFSYGGNEVNDGLTVFSNSSVSFE